MQIMGVLTFILRPVISLRFLFAYDMKIEGFCFEIGSCQVFQVGLELVIFISKLSNSRVTGMCHHPQLIL